MRPDDTTNPTTPQPATSTTSTTRSGTATADRDGFTALPDDERSDARRRWEEIETRFVDDPAGATRDADDLLGDTMDRITERWHDRRSELRDGWDHDEVSTEELRTTLKRYRSALEGVLTR